MNPRELVTELIGLGLTQTEIGERTGFAQGTISDVANGKVGHARPSYEMVTKLANLLAEVKQEKAAA